MKSFFRFLVILVTIASCSSCITSAIVSSNRRHINDIDRRNVHLTGKTVQKVGRHSALMSTDLNDVVCIIGDFTEYYDGMRINDYFRRSGTYEYRSVTGSLRYVPIFVRSRDYKKYLVIAEELDAQRESEKTRKDDHSFGSI